MSTRTLARRSAAMLAGGALAASGLLAVAPAPSAHAAPVNAQAEAAAAWLADQLDANGRFTTGFDAVGSTIDFGFSLQATDPASATLPTLTDGVEEVLATYIGSGQTFSASRLAKASAFLLERGRDLSDVDGANLLADLEAAVDDTTGQLGAFPDTYGQVWAVQVLDALGRPDAPEATAALIAQDCDDTGAWGYSFDGVCNSEVDATAYAILALLPQAGDTDVDAAIADGVAWLKSQQRADGGFGNWGVNENGTTSEANGTGLAAWALGEAGETDEAEAAATWVADHQVVDVPACGGPVPGETGAIAYDDSNTTMAIADGITPADRGTWVFAGAQALAGLAHLPELPATTGTVSGPAGYVRAGSTATIKVAGLRPGQTACLSGVGARQWVVGAGTATVTLPAGTRNHSVTLSHAGGSTTTTVKALGATKLKVKNPARVKAKGRLKVKVTGLAPGETVTVTVGKKRKTAKAGAGGKAVVKVKVAKKKGKTKVKAVGQFADRKGKATVRVV